MARPSDVKNEELRVLVEAIFAAMRGNRAAEAVKGAVLAYQRFLELYPEVRRQTFDMRGRAIPKVLRWPNLGANLKPESAFTAKLDFEFTRERFATSEAMTYYQFVLDEILAEETRLG
jgi:hypothetical protein